jgi:hypothetical protein
MITSSGVRFRPIADRFQKGKNMTERDDGWLTDQADHLIGVTLSRREWTADSVRDDHDHCALCWAKFAKLGPFGELHVGWRTSDGRHWVCQQCVDDFKVRFQWVLKDDPNLAID